jgi:hypothetical protein
LAGIAVPALWKKERRTGAWQVNRGSISDSMLSGHLSSLIAVQWLHL